MTTGLERQLTRITRFFDSDPGAQFLPDVCDLIKIELQSDGHSGQTPKETQKAENVRCRYDEVSGASSQIVVGGVTYTATHRLTFTNSAETMAIEPTYIVKVHRRGDIPQMIFEQPIKEKGSLVALVSCLAKFTVGFREPANV